MLLTIVTAGSRVALLQTQVGQQALVDEWERTALAFGQDVDDGRYAEFQTLSRSGAAYGLLTAIASGPVLTIAVAGLVFALFRIAPGQRATFTQVLAIAVHASVLLALRQVVAAAIGYASETTASATSLGTWFPTLDEASALARFVGAIDLFVVWWIVVLAIGVGVLYQRNARRLALTFLGVYAGVALLLAGTMAVLGGTA